MSKFFFSPITYGKQISFQIVLQINDFSLVWFRLWEDHGLWFIFLRFLYVRSFFGIPNSNVFSINLILNRSSMIVYIFLLFLINKSNFFPFLILWSEIENEFLSKINSVPFLDTTDFKETFSQKKKKIKI